MTEYDHPLALGTLASYSLGELGPDEEERVESHYFACAGCAERLRFVQSLAAQVPVLFREGRISAAVTSGFLESASIQRLGIRRYDVEIGGSVACTVAPDDDLVVTRLAVPLPAGTAVDVETEWEDLANGHITRLVTQDVTIDAEARGVLYAFAGDTIRAFPRSRLVLRVRARETGACFGPFTMNHIPWGELQARS